MARLVVIVLSYALGILVACYLNSGTQTNSAVRSEREYLERKGIFVLYHHPDAPQGEWQKSIIYAFALSTTTQHKLGLAIEPVSVDQLDQLLSLDVHSAPSPGGWIIAAFDNEQDFVLERPHRDVSLKDVCGMTKIVAARYYGWTQRVANATRFASGYGLAGFYDGGEAMHQWLIRKCAT